MREVFGVMQESAGLCITPGYISTDDFVYSGVIQDTMQKNLSIGVDIGGKHICCAAVDLGKNLLLTDSRARGEINNQASAGEILEGWAGAIRQTLSGLDREKLKGIGFAMPGPFDYLRGIARFERVEKFESLNGIHVSRELRQRLELPEDVQFRYMNDATAFAIAESWIGMARGFNRMLALTLGTGFGSAFLENGIPVIEGNKVPAEGCVWHLPFRDGIADDSFSTRWFERSYAAKTGKNVQGVREIAVLAKTETSALELFADYGSNMGTFLAPWLQKFEAGVVVLGGNISGAYELFGPFLQKSLEAAGVSVQIRISELKEDAAILGSARLISDNYWSLVENLLVKM